ncbi:amidase [Microbacterium xanthum]|uniref:amidase n=1 Tax=Microbacterium xanthum TaxID=3079794 RepID=UPI002AD53F82|nr:amidase family protein [Microbacterium sp. KSW-48]MDZ8171815.1 amidase family protein [Microbacterium sp. KSW-48]
MSVEADSWRESARAIAAGVRAGDLSAAAVVEAHLARVDEVNPRVGALTVVFAEQAREAAAAVDATVRAGHDPGPLAGVPFSVKENIDLMWSATTHGWRGALDAVPEQDATAVARLRAAGAIPLGRGNMPDFGMRWDTDNDVFGRTRNPWSTRHSPGGSSGGDAVAVATGMVAFGLGNDYGGSVRVPADAVGVVGFRPTGGRIPSSAARRRDPVPLSLQHFSTTGILARSADDVAAVFDIVDGADGVDPFAVTRAAAAVDTLKRAAIARDPFRDGESEANLRAQDAAVDALERAGWEIVEGQPPLLDEAVAGWRLLSTTEMQAAYGPDRWDPPLGAGASRFLELAGGAQSHIGSVEEYMAVWARRAVVAAAWQSFFRENPVLVGAVSEARPAHADADLADARTAGDWWRRYRLSVAANYLALPAIAVPTGLAADGLPVGVQVMAAAGADHLALAAARAIGQARGVPTPISPR